MGYLSPLYVIVLIFVGLSCGSTGEKKAQKNSADSVKQSITKQDSMPEVTPPDPGLPPNSMRVKGKLLKIHTAKNGIVSIEIRVQQVLGVGSATPTVAPSDTLLIKASALPDTLERGNEFVGIIRHRQVMSQHQKTSTPWQLERIENKQDYN